MENEPLNLGDDILVIGPTTGCVEQKVIDVRVDNDARVETVPRGVSCAVHFDLQPPVTRLHRGDKVYIWKTIE